MKVACQFLRILFFRNEIPSVWNFNHMFRTFENFSASTIYQYWNLDYIWCNSIGVEKKTHQYPFKTSDVIINFRLHLDNIFTSSTAIKYLKMIHWNHVTGSYINSFQDRIYAILLKYIFLKSIINFKALCHI